MLLDGSPVTFCSLKLSRQLKIARLHEPEQPFARDTEPSVELRNRAISRLCVFETGRELRFVGPVPRQPLCLNKACQPSEQFALAHGCV